ncbi:MAG: hypothetical protein BGN88_05405 [Clostridiales bacterium 43-6]|nr:MAG: hypothetical protein BGN88_05405 [Clostridiales bacterium 43-6]
MHPGTKTAVCCFSGPKHMTKDEEHRISKRLKNTIEELIKQGVTHFNTGIDAFDQMAGVHLIRLKTAYPDVRLNFVIPCLDRRYTPENKFIYNFVLCKADTLSVVSAIYDETCMAEQKRRISKNADFCISCENNSCIKVIKL